MMRRIALLSLLLLAACGEQVPANVESAKCGRPDCYDQTATTSLDERAYCGYSLFKDGAVFIQSCRCYEDMKPLEKVHGFQQESYGIGGTFGNYVPAARPPCGGSYAETEINRLNLQIEKIRKQIEREQEKLK